MKKRLYALLIMLTVYLWASPEPVIAKENKPTPRFEPTACSFNVPDGESIECGYLVVPEKRARSADRPIRLGVTIVKSHSLTPAPDPIIYLRGGMGRPTRWFIEHGLSQIEAWLAKRDVLLFDQRGLGWSQPALDCPEVHQSLLQEKLGVNLTLEERLAARLICRDRWLQQGIDLAAYNSFETAADVADLWQALGYEQVNLIGASYWTVVAQLTMRDYGQSGHIRSVVLDSLVPVTVPAMADTPAQLSSAMRRLFKECAVDWFCRLAYPDLETIYPQLIERLKTSPVTLWATNPLDGEPFSFQFTVEDFGFAIQYGAYREIPGLIYDIYEGNYTKVITDREAFIREFSHYNAGEHFGLRTTQNCNEPWNTISPEQRAAIAVYPEAVFMDNPLDTAFCEQWPAFDPGDQTLAIGDIPTLVFTAEYDTRLPAAYGELIVEPLSRGFHYHVPEAAHMVLNSGGPCPRLMLLSFLDDPTRPPDNSCLTAVGPPRFDTQFIIRPAAVRRPVQMFVGILSFLLVGIALGAGLNARRLGRAGVYFDLAWRSNLRLIGRLPMLAGGSLIGLAFLAAQNNLISLEPVETVALLLPIIVVVQSAFLFSPEDESTLEIILATSRPAAWILLERLATLLVLQGGVGMAISLLLAYTMHEPLSVLIVRWLPLVFLLGGMAVYVTLSTRRAIFGVLVVCLIWIVLALFGDFMIKRWPFAWPFHLYLSPNHSEYLLNRLVIALVGLSLIGIAATHLLNDTERLLLGKRQTKWFPKFKKRSEAVSLSAAAITVTSELLAVDQNKELSQSTEVSWWLLDMRTIFVQLVAIIRYEFLLQWRRVVLPAVVVGLVVTPLIGAVIAYDDFQGYNAALKHGSLSLEVAKGEITASMIPVIWLGAVLIAMTMVPLVAADVIPKDRQIGIRELLDALPLSSSVYLTGKLLSLWLSLSMGIVLAASASGIVWRWLIGPFVWKIFLELWFIASLLLILINAGSSMLLAAGQPTRRRAVLVGGGYVLLCLVGLGFVFSTDVSWWRWFNPARPAVLLHYLLGFPGAVQGNDELTKAGLALVQQVAGWWQVLFSLGAGLIQVGLIWLIIWQRLKRNRRH